MEKITIDTFGSMDKDFGLKFIIVIVDYFTRNVELFLKQVSAIAAADALWHHTCRFTAPLH